MATLVTRTIVGLALLLGSPSAAESQLFPSGDFGFRFEVGDCLTETFDTFSGVFTKDLGGEPQQSVTARFVLNEGQMRTVYQAIESLRFFDIPSSFIGIPLGRTEVRSTSPASSYRLEVRNAGIVHVVSWKDDSKPTTTEADRLRSLFSMIIAFIHDRPEFKRLPRATAGCE